MTKQEKQLDALLEQIAQEHLGLETLTSRGLDRLDFPEVSVWSLRKALAAAWHAGRDSGKRLQ